MADTFTMQIIRDSITVDQREEFND